MPYTLKTQQIAVKDPDTGVYSGVDILAEQTTEGLLTEITATGEAVKADVSAQMATERSDFNTYVSGKEAELDQYKSTTETNINTYVTNKNQEIATMIAEADEDVSDLENRKQDVTDAVAGMLDKGVDNTLTTANVPAESKAVGDLFETIVEGKSTQPNDKWNRLWIKPSANDVEIPTMDEFDDLKSALGNWNLKQLFPPLNSNNYTTSNCTDVSITENSATFTALSKYAYLGLKNAVKPSVINGHVYLFACHIRTASETNLVRIGINVGASHDKYTVPSVDWQRVAFEFTATSNVITNNSASIADTRTDGFDAINVKDIMLIDLTELFGDTVPTADEFFEVYSDEFFESDSNIPVDLRPLKIMQNEYREYGEIINESNTLAPFPNLFDKSTVINGARILSSGRIIEDSPLTCVSDFIKVKSGIEYDLTRPATCVAFDGNKSPMNIGSNATATNDLSAYTYKVPDNVEYVRIQVQIADAPLQMMTVKMPINTVYENYALKVGADYIGNNSIPLAKIRSNAFPNEFDELDFYLRCKQIESCAIGYASNMKSVLTYTFTGDGNDKTHYSKTFNCKAFQIIVLEFNGKTNEPNYDGSNDGYVSCVFYNMRGAAIGTTYRCYVFGTNEYGYHKYGFIAPLGTFYAEVSINTQGTTVVSFTSFEIKAINNMTKRGMNGVKLYAHLGCPMYAPQNSMVGFEMAKRLGYSAVITNVCETSDHVLVALHSDRISPVVLPAPASNKQYVYENTFSELSAFEIGTKFDNTNSYVYTGTKIPKLQDVIKFVAMSGMKLVIRMHNNWGSSEYTNELNQIYDYIKRYGLIHQTSIKSFCMSDIDYYYSVFGDNVDYIYSLSPTTTSHQTGGIVDPTVLPWASAFEGNITLEPEYSDPDLTQEWIDECISLGIPLSSYTVNSPVVMRNLLSMGITEFTTDMFSDIVLPS